MPSCLDLTGDAMEIESGGSGRKLYADIVEALLGLVYLHEDYGVALAVGDELGVTVPRSGVVVDPSTRIPEMDMRVQDTIRRVFGYSFFARPELLEEALTHRSAGNLNVPSYEQLEWLGDAVLCLASRGWIFENFGDLPVGQLVIMEGALVSNEALAFLSVKSGLHHFLDHEDSTLPPRIESYICSIGEDGCGLWGTGNHNKKCLRYTECTNIFPLYYLADPPKAIADIVESVLGAIFKDGGLSASLEAAQTVLAPLYDALLERKANAMDIQLMHPKKALQELAGETLEMQTKWESEWAEQVDGTTRVLEGKNWRPVDPMNTNVVAYLRFMGSTVMAVSSPSSSVACSQVCAVMVSLLRRNKAGVLDRLQRLRHHVERGCQSLAPNIDDMHGNSMEASSDYLQE